MTLCSLSSQLFYHWLCTNQFTKRPTHRNFDVLPRWKTILLLKWWCQDGEQIMSRTRLIDIQRVGCGNVKIPNTQKIDDKLTARHCVLHNWGVVIIATEGKSQGRILKMSENWKLRYINGVSVCVCGCMLLLNVKTNMDGFSIA